MRAFKASLAFVSAVTLQAATITVFSDFGPADAFNRSSGYSLGGGASRGNGGFTVAAPFTPSVDALLNRIDAAISIDVTGNLSPDLNIFLFADAGGVPGPVLESFALKGVGTVSAIIVSAVSVTHPLLVSGNRYWVGLAPPDLINAKDGFLFNTTGATASPFVAGRSDAGPYGNFGSTQPAFRVIGDTTAAVPETSTSLLLSFGLLGLFLFRGSRSARTAGLRNVFPKLDL